MQTPDPSNLPTNCHAQRERILTDQRSGRAALNRFTADSELNVLHLGARIKELKQLGYIFSVVRKPAYDLFGRLHPNIAHYTLKGYEKPAPKSNDDEVAA